MCFFSEKIGEAGLQNKSKEERRMQDVKVLVSTKETQGHRKSDFCNCEDGELVVFPTECDGEEIDGPCECRRAMVGTNSRLATTTIKVVHCDLTEREFVEKVAECMRVSGWAEFVPEEKFANVCRDEAGQVKQIANAFPEGTVLERRGELFRARRLWSRHTAIDGGTGAQE